MASPSRTVGTGSAQPRPEQTPRGPSAPCAACQEGHWAQHRQACDQVQALLKQLQEAQAGIKAAAADNAVVFCILERQRIKDLL